MGEVLPRHYLIAGVIFTFFVIGIFYTLNMVENGSTGDGSDKVTGFIQSDKLTEFNRTFNRVDNVTTDINTLKTKISVLQPENILDVISLPIAFVSTAWSAMKVVIGMFGFMDASFVGLSSMLGIPVWIPNMIILVVIIVLVFSILAIIFGKDA